MNQYHGGGSGDDVDGSAAAAHYLSMRQNIYNVQLPYKYHSKDVP